MAKDQFTSHMTSHYDTPGTFDKNLLVCHRRLIRLSTVNLKVKPVLQTAQHMTKQVKKLHTSKVKHTQTEQSKRRENRYQSQRIFTVSSEYCCAQYVKKTRHEQQMNTEHYKRKLKQRHIIY